MVVVEGLGRWRSRWSWDGRRRWAWRRRWRWRWSALVDGWAGGAARFVLEWVSSSWTRMGDPLRDRILARPQTHRAELQWQQAVSRQCVSTAPGATAGREVVDGLGKLPARRAVKASSLKTNEARGG